MPARLSGSSSRYVKSGKTTSTPGASPRGNIRPQSTSRRLPSCSKTIALRPISPSPPSAAMRIGLLLAALLLLVFRAGVGGVGQLRRSLRRRRRLRSRLLLAALELDRQTLHQDL